MRFNNSLRICFQFFIKAVVKLSDFTVEKEFKAIRNVLWKYDVVFVTKGGLRHLLRKSDKTGEFSWVPGSGGTTEALTNENVEEVQELILSQEENPESDESQRNIG